MSRFSKDRKTHGDSSEPLNDKVARILAFRTPSPDTRLVSRFCPAKECYARCQFSSGESAQNHVVTSEHAKLTSCPPPRDQKFNVLQLLHLFGINQEQRNLLVDAVDSISSLQEKEAAVALCLSILTRFQNVEEFITELLLMETPFVLEDYDGRSKEVLTVQELNLLESTSRRSDYDRQLTHMRRANARTRRNSALIEAKQHATAEQRLRIDRQRKAYTFAREAYRRPC